MSSVRSQPDVKRRPACARVGAGTAIPGLSRMNLGRRPGNYSEYAKTIPKIVENCAFWASLAHQSEQPKCRLAGGVGRAGIQCCPFRSPMFAVLFIFPIVNATTFSGAFK
jgi:hypothetical protein